MSSNELVERVVAGDRASLARLISAVESSDPEAVEAVNTLDDFEKQYPFVKGEIFRASGEKTLNRIITEARAGRSERVERSRPDIGRIVMDVGVPATRGGGVARGRCSA